MEHERSTPTAPEWASREIDRLRAELAAMCENHQAAVAHYRKRDAELAEARRALLAGNDTVLANKKLQEDNAALKARIAEFDVYYADLYADLQEWKGSTERAEALHEGAKERIDGYVGMLQRAEAERDALREFLEGFREGEARSLVPDQRVLDIIDAALAPSPAGEKT